MTRPAPFPANLYPGRELIMCSPTGTVGVGSTGTVTLTVSEPGRLMLSRLVVSASYATATSAATIAAIDTLNISSLQINGAEQLIRGRNSLAAPAGAFSAYRGINNIGLPDVMMNASDTLTIVCGSEATQTGAIDFSMAAAFQPSNIRLSVDQPGGTAYYAASTVAEIAANTAGGTATWTADESGVVALGSLQYRSSLDLASAGGAAGDWADADMSSEISSIKLPTGNALVIGQNTPVLNGSYLAAGKRSYTWFNGGAIRCNGGDTIVFTINNAAPDVANTSFGFRFYPDIRPTFDGCK